MLEATSTEQPPSQQLSEVVEALLDKENKLGQIANDIGQGDGVPSGPTQDQVDPVAMAIFVDLAQQALKNAVAELPPDAQDHEDLAKAHLQLDEAKALLQAPNGEQLPMGGTWPHPGVYGLGFEA